MKMITRTIRSASSLSSKQKDSQLSWCWGKYQPNPQCVVLPGFTWSYGKGAFSKNRGWITNSMSFGFNE